MATTAPVRERRYVTHEFSVRTAANGKTVIEGHAAVFNRLSQNLGGFVEEVAPGAFAKTITEADIRALFNHDINQVLARNKAGTLRLAEDNIGLAYEIDTPDTMLGRDLAVLMERGDISQSSFSFRVVGPNGVEWGYTEEGFPKRRLLEVAVYDVGPVTFPAYLEADSNVAARAALTHFVTEARCLDDVCALAAAGDLRSLIDGTEGSSEPVAPTRSIDIARRRLELLELETPELQS